jgi:hypothetical protein
MIANIECRPVDSGSAENLYSNMLIYISAVPS